MPESFDPYFEWLGIESGGRPPQHYRLLGLECRESEPEVIARAADAAMARLRRVRPGAHLAEWGRLLDQLRAVKVCLLNPVSKAAYDASLADPPPAAAGASSWAASSGPREPALATPPVSPAPIAVEERPRSPFPVGFSQPPTYAAPDAIASPPPVVVPVSQPEPLLADIIPIARPAVEAASTHATAGSWTGPLIAGLLVLVVGLGGALGYVRYQRGELPSVDRTAQVAQNNAAAAKSPATSTSSDTKTPKQNRQSRPAQISNSRPTLPEPAAPAQQPATPIEAAQTPAPQPKPSKPEPAQPPVPEKPQPPTVDAKKVAVFTQAVAEARTAMSERDLASARKHIKTASTNVQTPEDVGQIDRIETMVENLTQFWNGIRASVAKYQPTDEIVINNEPIMVVESGRDYLTVRAAGRVRRYQVETMPTPLVKAIIDQSFCKDAGSKAIVGTFLAVDPDGDRALAKKYWQEAAKAGVDSEKLLHELDGQQSPISRPSASPP